MKIIAMLLIVMPVILFGMNAEPKKNHAYRVTWSDQVENEEIKKKRTRQADIDEMKKWRSSISPKLDSQSLNPANFIENHNN